MTDLELLDPSINDPQPWHRLALESVPVGVLSVSLRSRAITYVNSAFTRICGPLPEAVATTLEEWIARCVQEQDRAKASEFWAAAFGAPTTGTPFGPIEIRIHCQDGTVQTVIHEGVALPDAGYALATFVDITLRKQKEVEVREAEAVSRMLLEHSHEMVVILPGSGGRSFASPSVEKITGWTPQEYMEQKTADLVHPEDHDAVLALSRSAYEGNAPTPLRFRMLLKDGGFRWVEGRVVPYGNPPSEGFYAVSIHDITSQKEVEDTLVLENSRLAELAQIDELTGIANRRVFNNTLRNEIRRGTRSSQALALLMLDVDNFKQYNDLYGHLQGDWCLRQIAQTLKQTLHRAADLVARYGGEEFAMLLPSTEREGAERVAENVLAAVNALRIPHQGNPSGFATLSIGISVCTVGSPSDEELLLGSADKALYEAKRLGRNCYIVG